MGWACGVHGGENKCIRTGFSGQGEGKRSYAGPRHKWEGSINMDLKERG